VRSSKDSEREGTGRWDVEGENGKGRRRNTPLLIVLMHIQATRTNGIIKLNSRHFSVKAGLKQKFRTGRNT